jgi:hypothetical protein
MGRQTTLASQRCARKTSKLPHTRHRYYRAGRDTGTLQGEGSTTIIRFSRSSCEGKMREGREFQFVQWVDLWLMGSRRL